MTSLPSQIWALRSKKTGVLILADDHQSSPFLAFQSKEAALSWAGANRSIEPVRIK